MYAEHDDVAIAAAARLRYSSDRRTTAGKSLTYGSQSKATRKTLNSLLWVMAAYESAELMI